MSEALGRVAVTGATGFMGGHLARALVARGVEPLLLARMPPEGEDRHWARLDLTQPDTVADVFRREQPDTIFHLAGVRPRGDDAALLGTTVNVTGTVAVLEAARRFGARRVVMVGSADVFGGRQMAGPLSEDLPLAPTSLYGLTAAAACQFAQLLHRTEGCPVVVLRMFSVYGPGQPAGMFVAQAVRAAVAGERFEMTNGIQRRDLVYVDDVVGALLAAGTAPNVVGRVIHVGSGEAHRLRDVAALIWRLTRCPAPLAIGARPAPPEEVHDTWADIRLAQELLGWRPEVGLEAGLSATVRSARERQEELACPTA